MDRQTGREPDMLPLKVQPELAYSFRTLGFVEAAFSNINRVD